MSSQEVTDLIMQIKAKANALEYNEDGIAFDKAVGEIDLLCYELRTAAWPKPRTKSGLSGINIDELEI